MVAKLFCVYNSVSLIYYDYTDMLPKVLCVLRINIIRRYIGGVINVCITNITLNLVTR